MRVRHHKIAGLAGTVLLTLAGIAAGMVLGAGLFPAPGNSTAGQSRTAAVVAQRATTATPRQSPASVPSGLGPAVLRSASDTTPDAPINWLCVNGHTFVTRGAEGIARFPEMDSICEVRK